MLSPEYLQKITESTEQKVAEINTYLTAKIVKRIIKLYEETGEVKLIPSSLHDIKKQQSAGRLLEEIQQEIEWLLPDIKEEIRKAFYDAGAKIANDVNATIGEVIRIEHENGNLQNVEMPQFKEKEKANRISDLNMTEKEIRFLESAYRRTEGELYNLTGTSASRAQSLFIEACDTAYFKATHGVSMNTAIIDAIKEVSKKGVTTVHYASGREDKIEVAIARAVRTGVNQANGDITLTRCAEAGVNYVVVSSHLGARVTPYQDYRTHAEWQGKVYMLDWKSPELTKYIPKENEQPNGEFTFLNDMKNFFQEQKDPQYEDFIKACGYGKMLGICGINCRHSMGLFYPGISVNNKIQFNAKENERRYENEQKQRSMERAIRNTKRELNVLETSGIDTEESINRRKLLEKQLERQDDRYKDFCKKQGLKPVNYRLQVAKTKGVDNEGVVNRDNMLNEQAVISLKKENNAYSVNRDVINRKEYHDKFDKLAISKNVSEAAYKEAGRLLEFTDGNEAEYMIAINSRTGSLIVDNLLRKGENFRTGFNEEEYKKILECKDSIILIHNHSYSVRPSGRDIVTYAENDKVIISLIACHDGDVYAIMSADKSVANIYQEAYNHYRKEFDDGNAKTFATSALYKENEKKHLFEVRRL